jgi:hypothetical protein
MSSGVLRGISSARLLGPAISIDARVFGAGNPAELGADGLPTGVSCDVITLSDSFFEDARSISPFKCDDEAWKAEAGLYTTSKQEVERLCQDDQYIHYLATDTAVRHVLASCPDCARFVITEGGVNYAGDFLQQTLSRGDDIVVTDFEEKGQKPTTADVIGGRLHLGGVVFAREVFHDGAKGFLNSLPQHPIPRDVKDADVFLVEKLFKHGARLSYVHEPLLTVSRAGARQGK